MPKFVEFANPCWSGYQMVGMKDKNGTRVPNCVPKEEDTSADREWGTTSLADTYRRETPGQQEAMHDPSDIATMRASSQKKQPPSDASWTKDMLTMDMDPYSVLRFGEAWERDPNCQQCRRSLSKGEKDRGDRICAACVKNNKGRVWGKDADDDYEEQVEHIVKVGDKYRLVSKSGGKNLGTYDTKAGAEKRERQVQYFKQHEDTHMAIPSFKAFLREANTKTPYKTDHTGGSGQTRHFGTSRTGKNVSVRSNAYGNWYAYIGAKRVDSFFGSDKEQEEKAIEWLTQQLKEDTDSERITLDSTSDGMVTEVTPPGMEDWVRANKKRFEKEYGAEKGKQVLYAKAWDMYHSGKAEAANDVRLADDVAPLRQTD